MNAEKEAIVYEILSAMANTQSAQCDHNHAVDDFLLAIADRVKKLETRIAMLERQGTREN